MTPSPDRRLDDILAAALRGGEPPGVVLMRLLSEAPSEEAARAALSRAATSGAVAGAGAVRRLWAAQPQAWSVVRATLGVAAHDRASGAPGDALAYWAEVFDRLAKTSPEAGVALYALGSADLLDAATGEVVALLDALGLLDGRHDALDLGCGIGRFAAALSPRLRTVLGIDIAEGMVAEARRRCAGLSNVRFLEGSGRDLAMLAAASVDLVLAADVFPYLVQADLANTLLGEVARVLRPGGRALILNYSYRGDPEADRREVRALALGHGLTLVRDGRRDLDLWDAPTFLLAAPSG